MEIKYSVGEGIAVQFLSLIRLQKGNSVKNQEVITVVSAVAPKAEKL